MKQLDVTGYRSLEPAIKIKLDQWLADEGIDKSNIYNMELDENVLRVHRFCIDGEGKRYILKNTKEDATEVVELPYFTEPPAGVFK